jgi:hypothetical protein
MGDVPSLLASAPEHRHLQARVHHRGSLHAGGCHDRILAVPPVRILLATPRMAADRSRLVCRGGWHRASASDAEDALDAVGDLGPRSAHSHAGPAPQAGAEQHDHVKTRLVLHIPAKDVKARVVCKYADTPPNTLPLWALVTRYHWKTPNKYCGNLLEPPGQLDQLVPKATTGGTTGASH